jgi:hypothetical protein
METKSQKKRPRKAPKNFIVQRLYPVKFFSKLKIQNNSEIIIGRLKGWTKLFYSQPLIVCK